MKNTAGMPSGGGRKAPKSVWRQYKVMRYIRGLEKEMEAIPHRISPTWPMEPSLFALRLLVDEGEAVAQVHNDFFHAVVAGNPVVEAKDALRLRVQFLAL